VDVLRGDGDLGPGERGDGRGEPGVGRADGDLDGVDPGQAVG
jgi:hypothetical protein